VINVGKRCGQKLVTQEQIHEWMIAYAREGRSVVRLKGGDPALFGRAAEELAALGEAEVPFEVVPGISAAFAASAAAKVSLTDRDASSRVVFTTRHRAGNEFGGVHAADVGSTLVLYMPGKNYPALAEELLAQGWPPHATCILVSGASLHSEQVVRVGLSELAGVQAVPAPSVILVIPPDAVAAEAPPNE
jgi:siroheme synthase